ncbi:MULTISPECIES: zinc ribbon domain-containing protein [Acidianus]|uniref:zinc ribbon domain-containing protein n=1 Tax=Acidianus TaxID=12914 RepID=UPI0009DEB967|nr:transposase [Acidianus sp. RZ1]
MQGLDEKDTSRTCSKCGYRLPKAPPDVRDFVCPRCGYTTDRDVNSSDNMGKQW